ncbi:STP13, partial [Symbiodinium sp. CCMP2456]
AISRPSSSVNPSSTMWRSWRTGGIHRRRSTARLPGSSLESSPSDAFAYPSRQSAATSSTFGGGRLSACRKGSIILGSFIFLAGSWVQVGAYSVTSFCIGRLIAGCSIGLLSTVVALYQSEVAPAHRRGGLTSLYQFNITLGILVAAAVDVPLVKQGGGWRIAIILQSFPALCL